MESHQGERGRGHLGWKELPGRGTRPRPSAGQAAAGGCRCTELGAFNDARLWDADMRNGESRRPKEFDVLGEE